jgi:hypothetical protein
VIFVKTTNMRNYPHLSAQNSAVSRVPSRRLAADRHLADAASLNSCSAGAHVPDQ